ncbi:thiolase family protein [Necropsobacter rosorum]|uniref:thiolase family protein n=1 Tax=Necropsobacter rosorum TaxID=908285 RepID=UPI000509FC7F
MMNVKEVVIVSGVRLPVGAFGGSLKDISAIDMGAMVVKEAVSRAGIAPELVDEVIIGQVGQAAENGFSARAISLKAGLPKETLAYSVNRQCGSSLQSIISGVMAIQLGDADIVVAGGVENISQLPYYIKDARWGTKMGHKVFEDGVIDILTWPLDGNHNGVTAENVAEKFNVSREEQDQFALASHQKAEAAIKAGKFKAEILPVELKDHKGNVTIFDTDEGVRFGLTLDKLERLKPCFVKGGTVTAGNSSSLNDGAAAVVLMSKEKALELGIAPKLIVGGYALSGYDAELMGYSPKFSSEKLAQKLGINLQDIDMFEINEAFASQAVAVARDLGLSAEKINIFGGGISIGHPIGATGTVLTVKVLYELMRTDKKDALISMCIGGGQGISLYLKKFAEFAN